MVPWHGLNDICQVDNTWRVGRAINFKAYYKARFGIFGHSCFVGDKHDFLLWSCSYGPRDIRKNLFLIYSCDHTSASALGEMEETYRSCCNQGAR